MLLIPHTSTPRRRRRRGRQRPPVLTGSLLSPSFLLTSPAASPMVVAGLYCWGNAPRIAAYFNPPRPDVAARAVRAGSVAWLATAELVLVSALRLVFPRRRFDRAWSAA